MFDGCKHDDLNVIFSQTGGKKTKKEGNTLMISSSLAQSISVSIHPSASPSSCLILTMPCCPSLLCSAHWAVAATLPGFEAQTGGNKCKKTWRHLKKKKEIDINKPRTVLPANL